MFGNKVLEQNTEISITLASVGEALGALPLTHLQGGDISLIEPTAIATRAAPSKEIEKPGETPDANADFAFARANLVEAISTGQQLLGRISLVAAESESARMFEVAASMIGTQIIAAKSLLSLHEQHRKLLAGDTKSQSDTIVNNNNFIGSTTELQKLLRQGA